MDRQTEWIGKIKKKKTNLEGLRIPVPNFFNGRHIAKVVR
jgi:hypothetical protein